MSLKLAIGIRYLSRDGTETVKIIRKATKTDVNYKRTHPFVDEEGYAYMPDGRSHATKDYSFDLVSLAPARMRSG